MSTGETYRSDRATGTVVLYVGLIAFAEVVTANWLGPIAFENPVYAARVGVALHGLLMILLLLHGALLLRGRARAGRLVMAMSIAPLVRVLSVSIPNEFRGGTGLYEWLLLLAVPLFIALVFTIRTQRFTPQELGLVRPRPGASLRLVELLVLLLAIGLGVIETQILAVDEEAAAAEGPRIMVAVLAIFLTTAVFEEVYFRGVLHQDAIHVFGVQPGIFLVSLLFGILHIGNRSLADLALVFIVGWSFAQVRQLTGSVWMVIVGHTLANIMLFLVGPRYL